MLQVAVLTVAVLFGHIYTFAHDPARDDVYVPAPARETVSAQELPGDDKLDLSAFPYLVVTPSDVDSIPPFSDEEFYDRSGSVIFAVNKTDVAYDNPFFDLYYNTLLPYVNARHLQLRKIFIRGAASPEGPYEGNRRLGIQRSQTLLDLIRNGLRHQYVTNSEEVSSIIEDYGYLCILMQKRNDPDYRTVRTIYDTCGGDERCCKERLMAHQQGKLWRRLLKEYFADLRAARFVLWFSEPDAEHAPVIEPARRDTIFVTDTLVVHRTVVVDTVSTVQMPPFICNGHIHIGCIHDCTLHPAPVDTVRRHPLFAIKTNLLFDVVTFLNAEIEVPLRRRHSVMAEVVWPWWLQRSNNRWCCEMGSVSLEGRWWFRPWEYHSTYQQWRDSHHAPLQGMFVGAYISAGYYDFQLPTTYDYPEGLSPYEYYRKGKQGEFISAGFTFGYSRYIGRHWRFEASIGIGAAYTEYRSYHIDANTDTEPDRDQHLWRDEHEGKYDLISWLNFRDPHPKSDGRYLWIGPTKAKLSISWLFTTPCRKNKKQKGGAL